MSCVGCGAFVYDNRSTYCFGCGGCHTLLAELSGEWPSNTLRGVAADLIVSCARSVRALRIYSGRDLKPTGATSRVEEPRARSRSPLQRSRRTQRPARRGAQPVDPEKEERKAPLKEKEEAEEFYSYYPSEEEEETSVESLEVKAAGEPRDLPGIAPKARPEKGGEPAKKSEVAESSGGPGPKAHSSKKESLKLESFSQREEKDRAKLTEEFNKEQLKESIKADYFKDQKKLERRRLEKGDQQVKLQEAPRTREKKSKAEESLGSGNFVLAEDLGRREKTSKRRRKKQWWTWRKRTPLQNITGSLLPVTRNDGAIWDW